MNPQDPPPYPPDSLAAYSPVMHPESQSRSGASPEAELFDWSVNVLASPALDPNLMNYYQPPAHRADLPIHSNTRPPAHDQRTVMAGGGTTSTLQQPQPQLRRAVSAESQDGDAYMRTTSGGAARKPRGRPRLDTKDENAADVSWLYATAEFSTDTGTAS